MMDETFAIRSLRILVGDEKEPRPATVVVRYGKIERILDYGDVAGGIRIEDFGEKAVLPGIFDTHAHINEPGRTDWEGFLTATRAAAAGGITTVVDMPLNSIPATTTLAALKVKAETAAGKCAINYGFWGGVVPGNAAELEPMVKAGALGFKCFLIESGVDEFPMSTEADLRIAMPILVRLGVPLLVHAELECGSSPASPDNRSYAGYLDSRPAKWEVEAIRMMIRLARETKCAVHIVHLSAAEAIADIRKAKSEGVPITVETCPHYLFFESEKIAAGATQFKCAPPIRDHGNREGLWAGLADGAIDFIVSDHSPCTPALKSLESGDFGKAWGGIAGLQFSLPVVWTEASRRGFSLRWLSDRMSARTARFAGQSGRTGFLRAGLDADLIVFDPDERVRPEPAMILHRHTVTPYAGCDLFGKVGRTYVRGRLVYADDRFPESPPAGETIHRSSL